MKVFHTVEEVVQWRQNQIGDRCLVKIGFVPTMGALHQGHATLIRQSVQDNDYTVCSIFVNPSQFAPNEDLDLYPRTLPEDISLLESLHCDVLFAPTAKEMYPRGIPLTIEDQRGPFVNVLGVSEMLEGRTRPNFFRGVATVVTKLLNIVSPDIAYFGQKDIQQFIVLDVMCRELFMNVTLKMMPIARAANGLALSSRNKYLSEDTKANCANHIYAGLRAAETLIRQSRQKEGERSIGRLSRDTVNTAVYNHWTPFTNTKEFEVDYLSVARRSDLTEINDDDNNGDLTDPAVPLVISCAVYVTDRVDPTVRVRLIDNILIE